MRLGSYPSPKYLKSFTNVLDGLVVVRKPLANDDKFIYLCCGLGDNTIFL